MLCGQPAVQMELHLKNRQIKREGIGRNVILLCAASLLMLYITSCILYNGVFSPKLVNTAIIFSSFKGSRHAEASGVRRCPYDSKSSARFNDQVK